MIAEPTFEILTLDDLRELAGEMGLEMTDAQLERLLLKITVRLGSYCPGAPQGEDCEWNLRVVALGMAERMLGNPDGLRSERFGPYSYTAEAAGLGLTEDEKSLLWCCHPRAGTVRTEAPRLPWTLEAAFPTLRREGW